MITVTIERINRIISLNLCFLRMDVSETEKTITAITPNSIILNINKNSRSLYGFLPEIARAVRYIIAVSKTSGLKILAIMGAILLVNAV